MRAIRGADVERCVSGGGRAYLCGNLALPQGLEHIPTDGYEIGITEYAAYTLEQAHAHRWNAEYDYVIRGEAKVLMLSTMEEEHLVAGDLLLIEPGEPHVGKMPAGTRILFTKVPGGNDKEIIEHDAAIDAWGASWQAGAPAPGAMPRQ